MCRECACPEKYDDRDYVTAESKFARGLSDMANMHGQVKANRAVEVAPDQVTIISEIEMLSMNIDILHGAISALRDRLNPILRQDPETATNAVPTPCLSPVAHAIWEQKMRVRYAIESIGRLRELAELP